jgi:nitrogen regulatory protein PII
MKLVLAIVDAERADATRADLVELGAPGLTELPVTSGTGRTGIHSGDRVHPGGLVVLFAAVDDADAISIFDGLASRRDAAGDRVSRFFLLPVERQV